MKKKLVLYALSTNIILFLNGCGGSPRDEKEITPMNDPKKTVQNQAEHETEHTCSCPHDEHDETMMVEPQKTESGLMYVILEEGPANGAQPKKGQVVTVHYTGWLDDNGQIGKKFDSSVDRGQPFQFVIGVGQVIKGWDEGVMGMKVGETRHLIIPAHLGYGARGAGGLIPGNATLHFEVQLLGVK